MSAIVPRYWGEAKARSTQGRRQITVQRFGWSDESEAAAHAHAEARVAEALKELARTGKVRRRDHKVGYNGAEGLPIREEVVAVHGVDVVTRNGYGARCLNTPDVLFADIDFPEDETAHLTRFGFGFWLLVIAAAVFFNGPYGTLIGFGIAILAFGPPIIGALRRRQRRLGGTEEERALARIASVSEAAPELNLHVYRTPAGLRVIALDGTYDPRGDDARALLEALGADPVYVSMCRNQNCFRARLSPKPWRIDMRRLPAATSVWPLSARSLAARQTWTTEYEALSENFAACRFLTRYGSERLDPRCGVVRALHDDACKAHDTTREIA